MSIRQYRSAVFVLLLLLLVLGGAFVGAQRLGVIPAFEHHTFSVTGHGEFVLMETYAGSGVCYIMFAANAAPGTVVPGDGMDMSCVR